MENQKRMLIVDDEETLTFSLYQTFILAKKDYEVITASSGEEAIGKLREQYFDLVISDISMPGMNGLELLSTIKKQFRGTEVIIMTAYGSQEKRDEAMFLGARYYIEKPFEIKEFKQLVMNVLN